MRCISSVLISSVMLWATIGGPCLAASASDQRSLHQREEFARDMKHLRGLRVTGKLGALEATAAEYQEKWFAVDKELYGYAVLETCGVLTSFRYDDQGQYELARQQVMSALARLAEIEETETMPIEVHLKLVTGYLQSMYRFKQEAAKEDWTERRREIGRLYFDVWSRLETAIDPNFDPNSPLPRWPEPVGFTGIWISGMSPEAIEDDSVRTQYEDALTDFWEKTGIHNEQTRLRRLRERFVPKLRKQIRRLYSGPLFEGKELEAVPLRSDLEEMVLDARIRELIADSVNAEGG